MRRAFTLIELLLVIGIIAVISAIVIVAINPTKQLGDAQSTERRHNANQIEKAQFQYLIDYGELAGNKTIPEGAENQLPICRGNKEHASCVNIDALIPNYIACIPFDGAENDANRSGYAIYQASGRPKVDALHTSSGSTASGCEEPPSPIAHWKFDDGPGQSTAIDSSGNNNNGTLTYMDTASDWVTDYPSSVSPNTYALDFDGSNDRIVVPHHATFNDLTNITIAVWVKKAPSCNFDCVIISKSASWSATGIPFEVLSRNDNIGVRFVGNVGWNVFETTPGSLPDNTWVHVAASWDGTTVKIFQDGAQVHSQGKGETLVNNTTDVYIGGSPGGGYHWHGKLDDIRIYDQALELSDIQVLASGSPLARFAMKPSHFRKAQQ